MEEVELFWSSIIVPEPVVIPLVESGIFMIFEFIAIADKPALTSSLEILVPVICIVWFALKQTVKGGEISEEPLT